jgi:hypothetical protein
MSKLLSLAAGILAGSLLAAVGSSAQAQSPDELLALAANRPVVRGTAKPDGPRFTTSAARFADVKRDFGVPRAAAKRDDREPFTELGVPAWLRLSPASAEEASLRKVPEVGLPPLKTRKDLGELLNALVKHSLVEPYDPHNQTSVLANFGHAEIEGLPFRKRHAWTIDDDKRAATLNWTSATIRALLDGEPAPNAAAFVRSAAGPYSLSAFFQEFKWSRIDALRAAEQKGVKLDEFDLSADDTAASAVLPGLMQILAVQAPMYRHELIRQLRTQTVDDDAATTALVRLALFDADAEVRQAAVKSLVRQPADKVGKQLMEAYRYPWHIIAERATEAIIELDRVDLLPALVAVLDEPDPTAPFYTTAEKKQLAVREVVKLNHNRNCFTCHAPFMGATSREPVGLQIRVPAPDEALPPISSRVYYNTGAGGFPAIQANHVLLRQDFSRMDHVDAPGDWPDTQRYDYLVRTRKITPAEAGAWKPAGEERGAPSLTHRAVLVALTRLTSVYAGEHAGHWKVVLQAQAAERQAGR